MTNNSDLGSGSPAPTKRTWISEKGLKPGAKTKDKDKVVMTATMKRRALKPKAEEIVIPAGRDHPRRGILSNYIGRLRHSWCSEHAPFLLRLVLRPICRSGPRWNVVRDSGQSDGGCRRNGATSYDVASRPALLRRLDTRQGRASKSGLPIVDRGRQHRRRRALMRGLRDAS